MTPEKKSKLLFLLGCMPARILLVYLAMVGSKKVKQLLAYLAIIIAVGFLYIYFTGARKVGAETFGQLIWWNNLRPIHAGLYLAFAYNALHGCSCAWKYLATDVVIGFLAFIWHHYF